MEFRAFIREVPDFPSAGDVFRDFRPLLMDARAFSAAVDAMAEPARLLQPTHVLAIEARGFIFGSALAQTLGLGIVPATRSGKLPPPFLKEELASGDTLEILEGALRPGDRVLIVDDVLAYGETASAARRLVQRTGAQPVGLTLFMELGLSPGREKLSGLPVFSVLRYLP